MKPQIRRACALSETVGDELIVYDAERHTAHRLNPTAASVWRRADGTRTVQDLVADLQAGLSPSVDEALVLGAIDMLAEAGLLVDEPAPEAERMSRRAALAKVAAVALPLVASIVVPEPIAASSQDLFMPDACGVSLSPQSVTVPATGGSGTVTVTCTCGWIHSSSASWLTATTTATTIAWTASANTTAVSRSATITVGSGLHAATVTFTQAAMGYVSFNGTYTGTANLRSPYGCGDFFVRTFAMAGIVALTSDSAGTVTHRSITYGYERQYNVKTVTYQSDGWAQIISETQRWYISGYPFNGTLTARVNGTTYQEEEKLQRVDGTCTDYFDSVATK